MSHDTKIEAAGITDVETLKEAFTELDLEIVVGGERRGYRGKNTRCDFVVKFDKYDLGFNVKKDGTIQTVTDNWGLNGDRKAIAFAGCKPGGTIYKEVMKKIRTGYSMATINKQMKRRKDIGSRRIIKRNDGKVELRYRVR